MRLYIATALLLSSCFSGEIRHKEFRLGDTVKFEFKQRNLFYADACSNVGVVMEMRKSWEEDAAAEAYIVKTRCVVNDQEISRFIWIDAEDIVDVVQLAKRR
jgi:hypothetical protein